MNIKKKIIKQLLKNPDKYSIDNYKNISIYESVTLIYSYLKSRNINKICVYDEISLCNKVIVFLLNCLSPIDIYLYNETEFNDGLLLDKDSIINDIIGNKQDIKLSKIDLYNESGKIYYLQSDKICVTTWEKITNFIVTFRKNLKKYMKHHEKQDLYFDNLKNIYTYYFIPFAFTDNYIKVTNIEDKSSVLVSDNYNLFNDRYGIFLGSKYTYNYPDTDSMCMFFSFTLNQFLLYNVIVDSNKIVGKLLSLYVIKTINDTNILLYDDNEIKLPTTYKAITNNVIVITKKTSKLIKKNGKDKNINKISLTKYQNYIVKNNFSKLIFLYSKLKIDKISGFKLFKVLINTYTELDVKNYSNIFNRNYYLYNQIDQLDNSIFSLYLKTYSDGTLIIIHLSHLLLYLEVNIIDLVDKTIEDLVLLTDIYIDPVEKKHLTHYNSNSIHIVSEFKFFFIVFLYILPKFITNILNADISKLIIKSDRKQFIYKFNQEDFNKLDACSERLNISRLELFRLILFKSINKFYENKLILFGNSTGNYIIPCIWKDKSLSETYSIFEYVLKAKTVQSYLLGFIFSFLNKQEYKQLYPPYFIQIDEVLLYNEYKYVNLLKTNLNCDVTTFPIQISYYFIGNTEILLTISSEKEHDIIKYIVPEIFNMLE